MCTLGRCARRPLWMPGGRRGATVCLVGFSDDFNYVAVAGRLETELAPVQAAGRCLERSAASQGVTVSLWAKSESVGTRLLLKTARRLRHSNKANVR